MDSMPFTLFFVVCLIGFQEILAKPHNIVKRSIEWPKKCEGKYYCTEKPADYPSVEDLKKALQISNIDLSSLTPPSVDDRMSQELCPAYVDVKPVYMIIDENNSPRYTVQLPKIYQYELRIEECKKNEVAAGYENMVTCNQVTTPFSFLVLSSDKTKVEIAKPLTGIPTSCSARFIKQ